MTTNFRNAPPLHSAPHATSCLGGSVRAILAAAGHPNFMRMIAVSSSHTDWPHRGAFGDEITGRSVGGKRVQLEY
jgi:hypothetical protein